MIQPDLALARQLGAALSQRRQTVCAAESCTGGLFTSTLTDIDGSSAYVLGGVVSYSNAAKQIVLGVPEATLIAHGAVSPQTVEAMAQGALRLFLADWAVAISGIAGPGGSTPEKPVGLVYIACVGMGRVQVARHQWSYDRLGNKAASVNAALAMLYHAIHDDQERHDS
ncbi:MAG: CinA family protein [Anaerolineae bacterium]|nr:CinA family protein [Anaerolineae bacterium]MDW8172327.1 CinA family protein [Anaerolineae bacterium]